MALLKHKPSKNNSDILCMPNLSYLTVEGFMDKKILNHFKKVDPTFYKILKKIGEPEKLMAKSPDEFFLALCISIVNQQLSGKAADKIFERFQNLFPRKKITPENLLKLPDQKIRDAGLSWSKVKYLKDLAQKTKKKEILLEKLSELEDSRVIEELIKVKGLGRWTAEMFLMFSLAREDVFSAGDLGLKRAIEKIYNVSNPSRDYIEKVSAKWTPYRTWAARTLWKFLNNR